MDKVLCADEMSSGEDKFNRFNNLMSIFGNEMMKEGVCNGYRIVKQKGKINMLYLDGRPYHYDELPEDMRKSVVQRFHDLMYSCGITDDEYDESYGGLDWDLLPYNKK